jgi:hypothetical protein
LIPNKNSSRGQEDHIVFLYGLARSKCILVSCLWLILIAFFTQNYIVSVFASSPSYAQLEVRDEPFDWIDMNNNKRLAFNGDPSTDILSVNYHSNGTNLYSTLWLLAPINETGPNSRIRINYGMFIDADSNVNTGVDGIDYQIEISGQNRTWTRTFSQWSSVDSNRTLEYKYNYLGFSDRAEQEKYVLLDADLDAMGTPNKYRVIFYAEEINGSSWKTDFTNWINIPQPEVIMSTTPSSVNFMPGENKTIELQVKSNTDFNSDIQIYSVNQTPDIKLNFMNKELYVPSNNIGATPLHIKVSDDTKPRQYTIPIIINSSVPVESFIKPRVSEGINNSNMIPSFIKSEKITKQSSLTITVLEPLNTLDRFLESLKKFEFIITFTFGIIGGHIVPWIFTKVKRKDKIEVHENQNIDNVATSNVWIKNSDTIKNRMAERNKN